MNTAQMAMEFDFASHSTTHFLIGHEIKRTNLAEDHTGPLQTTSRFHYKSNITKLKEARIPVK